MINITLSILTPALKEGLIGVVVLFLTEMCTFMTLMGVKSMLKTPQNIPI